MKKILTILVFGLLLSTAMASVITSWSFESSNLIPEVGTGSITLIGGVTDDGYSAGTPGLGWSTTSYPAQGTNNLSAGIYLELSSEGFTDVSLSWSLRYSNTSANRAVLFYTLDKTAAVPQWTMAGVYDTGSGDTWLSGYWDGTAYAGVANNPNLAFKIVSAFSNSENTQYVAARPSSTYAGGKWRWDNISFQGTALQPYLSTTSEMLPFYAAPGAISAIQTYDLYALNLSSNLVITAPQYFKLRVLGTEDFGTQLTLLPRTGALNKTIEVIFQPIISGVWDASIIHSGGGVESQSLPVFGSTIKPQASSYPSSFAVQDISYYQAVLTWIDAVGTVIPDGYLIKGSKVGFAEIISPVDGVPETDKKLTKNVAAGVQNQLIFELNEAHPYFFKIFPFTNSGAAIDYLADEAVPAISFNTITGPIGSSLVPGSIAFVEYASDSPDRFSFVLLQDMAENTKINFTDKAWNGNAFAENEDVYEWRAVGRSYQQGEVIHIVEGILYPNEGIYNPDFTGFSNDGDQIIAYQGYITEPSFVAAFSTSGWLITGTPTNNSSYLPNDLELGVNALGFATEVDNGFYNGITSGTVASLRAMINDPANWTRANSMNNISFPLWNFNIFETLVSPLPYINSLESGLIRLSWESIPGASSYKVYSSDNPYASFPDAWDLMSANVETNSFDIDPETMGHAKLFFVIIAQTPAQ